jgi:hypothetical protein
VHCPPAFCIPYVIVTLVGTLNVASFGHYSARVRIGSLAARRADFNSLTAFAGKAELQ